MRTHVFTKHWLILLHKDNEYALTIIFYSLTMEKTTVTHQLISEHTYMNVVYLEFQKAMKPMRIQKCTISDGIKTVQNIYIRAELNR